jgi:small subunit ribosomal protein S1
LEKDIEKRRLSLSYKNTLMNPWKKFTSDYKIGDKGEGIVKNITDYGLFVSIKNTELDGLIHYKDLSWTENESELANYKKNQAINFQILEINQENEKIRLGIKQLRDDPFEFFINKNINDIITVVVQNPSQNGIYVSVGKKSIPILIKKNQLAKEPENQRITRFVKDDKLDAMITELDKEKRKVTLSIKALEDKQTKETVKKYGSKDSGGVLGDIFNFTGFKKDLKKKK